MEDILIIGSGAAGLTAAIYASRANLSPKLIAGNLPGGLLTQTSDVENFPGFPEAVNGYDLMYKIQQQAEKFGTVIINETVEKVEFQSCGPQKIFLNSGNTVECKALIIATGASPKWMGLESENRLKNKGVSACATCDGAFFRNVPVVVVGGGDSAMEEALFLTKFASGVTLIHRRDAFRASKIMSDRVLAHPKIKVMWNSTVKEVLGKDEVEGALIENVNDKSTSTVACKGYFAALGHIPNTAIFKDFIELEDNGYIKLPGRSSRTSLEGVFAAGDCADHVYRQAITAAGMGCIAAI
ncbi:MAG: thioredoxin-disulfide reductase, partial [Lentisphaerae bacterium GWF2_45_14]